MLGFAGAALAADETLAIAGRSAVRSGAELRNRPCSSPRGMNSSEGSGALRSARMPASAHEELLPHLVHASGSRFMSTVVCCLHCLHLKPRCLVLTSLTSWPCSLHSGRGLSAK